MMNIGIVCEGPTDYIILKEVIDKITGESNDYVQLQPEPDLLGQYGNGWKGVWKWCVDNASIKNKLMRMIEPKLDLLVIQMDGDVSRKEKCAHCWCETTICEYKGIFNPIECDIDPARRTSCPIILPCGVHECATEGHRKHLEQLIGNLLTDLSDTCIVIPCDSTESWIVAAYDELENAESIEEPWLNIIAKRKFYHEIKISAKQKSQKLFRIFAEKVCEKWSKVTDICVSAKKFEETILLLRGNE